MRAYSSHGSHQDFGNSLITGVHSLDVSCHRALYGETAVKGGGVVSDHSDKKSCMWVANSLTCYGVWESRPPCSSYVRPQTLHISEGTVREYGAQEEEHSRGRRHLAAAVESLLSPGRRDLAQGIQNYYRSVGVR